MQHLRGVVGPMLACVPMAAAVFSARAAAYAVWPDIPLALLLTIEVLVGVGVYIGSAFILVRETVTDCLTLLKDAFLSRMSGGADHQ